MAWKQLTVEEAIDAITFIGGDQDAPRVSFAADIGNCDLDTIEWKFLKDGGWKWVTIPKAAVTFLREQPMVNFWLVTMARPFAEMYGLEEFVLSDDEVAEHRKRILATEGTESTER